MLIYEILDAVEEAQTREEKMEVLASNDSLALRDLMKVNFDPNIKLYLSKNVNWTPSESPSKNLKDITKFLVPFVEENTYDLGRRDSSFKAMLESIHPMDAQYLISIVKKQLKVKGLTEKLVRGVWGDRIFGAVRYNKY